METWPPFCEPLLRGALQTILRGPPTMQNCRVPMEASCLMQKTTECCRLGGQGGVVCGRDGGGGELGVGGGAIQRTISFQADKKGRPVKSCPPVLTHRYQPCMTRRAQPRAFILYMYNNWELSAAHSLPHIKTWIFFFCYMNIFLRNRSSAGICLRTSLEVWWWTVLRYR